MSKSTGAVKFFDKTKGFGFIKVDGSKDEIFVHATGLLDEIQADDRVEFDEKEGKKGIIAVNVKMEEAEEE